MSWGEPIERLGTFRSVVHRQILKCANHLKFKMTGIFLILLFIFFFFVLCLNNKKYSSFLYEAMRCEWTILFCLFYQKWHTDQINRVNGKFYQRGFFSSLFVLKSTVPFRIFVLCLFQCYGQRSKSSLWTNIQMSCTKFKNLYFGPKKI